MWKMDFFPHVYSLYIDLKMNTRNSMFHLLVVVAGKGYVNSYNGFQSRKLLESHLIRNRTFWRTLDDAGKSSKMEDACSSLGFVKNIQAFYKAVCQTKSEMYTYIPAYMHACIHDHTCMHQCTYTFIHFLHEHTGTYILACMNWFVSMQ